MKHVFLALAVGLVVLPACTSVLGMERADLDENIGAAGAGGVGGAGGASGTGGTQTTSLSECTQTSDECRACLNSCGVYRDDCLRDRTCREAVDRFGICLRSPCADDGRCADRMRTEVANSPVLNSALRLLDCFRDECSATGGPCTGKTLVSKCERYCACMQHNCSPQFASWGSVEACLTACADLPERDRDCRGDHCEFGADDSVHCRHAVAEEGLDQCSSTPTPRLCLDRSDIGGPCEAPDDCCPGLTCTSQRCSSVQ
jgi:hypothetical protein